MISTEYGPKTNLQWIEENKWGRMSEMTIFCDEEHGITTQWSNYNNLYQDQFFRTDSLDNAKVYRNISSIYWKGDHPSSYIDFRSEVIAKEDGLQRYVNTDSNSHNSDVKAGLYFLGNAFYTAEVGAEAIYNFDGKIKELRFSTESDGAVVEIGEHCLIAKSHADEPFEIKLGESFTFGDFVYKVTKDGEKYIFTIQLTELFKSLAEQYNLGGKDKQRFSEEIVFAAVDSIDYSAVHEALITKESFGWHKALTKTDVSLLSFK